ncbi:Gfo/Idh/MocA family oxidoreductase [Chitinophaga sp. B61]|uniref:Gfo/Idh/MocA family oxidoreductase n=2 Tax=Chitinophaga rhizophila TaxID=2866212 RepID=A0ABS7G8H2_9BACT|nr:Gfo/Idh/MocA family oxidoreductase [Chitinophaga rhizophila]
MKILSQGMLLLMAALTATGQQKPLHVGVAGLSHDHVHQLMNQWKKGQVTLAGIAEPDAALVARYKKTYQLPDSLFYPDLHTLLNRKHPDAVLAYNAVAEHIDVVEACAPKGIAVMVEKPLATTVAQAERMAALARKHHIQVLTNYETTWYNTNQYVYDLVRKQDAVGPVRKMVVHDGHEGPREIGCSEDFLRWLTDPVKNGGGALMDFGCYGANLMTWLMNGKAPLSVTAVARHIKPDVYPKVDDDATILLEYPEATGIIEASWNWPFSIKDWEVFGTNGYLHALNPTELQQRKKNEYQGVKVPTATYTDNITYLAAVLNGTLKPGNDLSSLENNLIVVRILEAARKSAKTGRKILIEY